VSVAVHWPDATQDRTFEYQVVDLPRLIPSLVGVAASSSLTPNTNLPQLNTVSVMGALRFDNGRELPIRELQTGLTPARLGLLMSAPIGPALENEFGQNRLESVSLTLRVENRVRAAQLVGLTVHQTAVRPGAMVVAHVRLLRYRSGQELHRVEIPVPSDLPDGQYTLSVSGAQVFHEQRMLMRPHLARATSADELFQALGQIYALRDDALYASLRLRPSNNIAIGRTELPRLPGSRVALLAVEGSTRSSPYLESIEVVHEMPYVVLGGLAMQIDVRRDAPPGP
jgi:hypothetical protein